MALVELGHERRMNELRASAAAMAMAFNDPKKIPTLGRDTRGGADPVASQLPPAHGDDQPPPDDVRALAQAGADQSFLPDYL